MADNTDSSDAGALTPPPTPTLVLRNFEHASRLFVDSGFKYSPKQKFLFYVQFDIDSSAISVEKFKNDVVVVNMLVKNVDLPSFTIKTDQLNQYNRVKNTQIHHRTNEVSIMFHDDNANVINQLWQNYYAFYYADSVSAKESGTYNRTAMKNISAITKSYGLNHLSIASADKKFFKSITIFQFSHEFDGTVQQRKFTGYKLHNPIITSWNHNKMDYSDQGTNPMDNVMKLQYEAVSYEYGELKEDSPPGFATILYDKTPSPLMPISESEPNTEASTDNAETNAMKIAALAQTDYGRTAMALVQINNYQNRMEIQNRGSGIITNINAATQPTVVGITDIAFPVKSNNSAIQATLKKFN